MNQKIKTILLSSLMLIVIIQGIYADGQDDQVDQEQTDCKGVFYATFFPGELAQSFKPTLNVLSRVKLYGFRNSTESNDLIISIRKDLGGPDLTSVQIDTQSMLHLYPSWFEADFPDIQVIPESTYYIVWAPMVEQNESRIFFWCYARGNPGDDFYERGDQYLLGSMKPGADFTFQTYGYSNPTISITSPNEQDDVYGFVTIMGSAEDGDGIIERVEIKIDNGSWMTVSGINPWQYEWNTFLVENGPHVIFARSYDGITYSPIVSLQVNVMNTEANINNLITGLGTISVDLTNTGDVHATNIIWDIEITGGMLNRVESISDGMIGSLAPDETETIYSGPEVNGFGFITIAIRISADNAIEVSSEYSAFLIGPFIILLPE